MIEQDLINQTQPISSPSPEKLIKDNLEKRLDKKLERFMQPVLQKRNRD